MERLRCVDLPDGARNEDTISVAICLYNGAGFIEDALSSVFRQTCQPAEVVIVDDGSTDDGVALIERRFPEKPIRIIRQANRGIGGARAAGLEAARGRYIAFLDQDDTWRPDKLQKQLVCARAHPDAGLIFSDSVRLDSAGVEIDRASDVYALHDIRLDAGHAFGELLRRGCFIDLSTAFVRSAVLRRLGGFGAHWRYVEDYDMWLRVARQYSVAYVAEPLAMRRVHAGQATQQLHALALHEEVALLSPLLANSTYPPSLREAIAHYLFGQHQERAAKLFDQRQRLQAAWALAGMVRYPMPLARLAQATVYDIFPRARPTLRRVRDAVRSVKRRGAEGPAGSDGKPRVWIDGSALVDAETGYFNLTLDLIRRLARHGDYAVRVLAHREGSNRLRPRLDRDAERISVVRPGRHVSPSAEDIEVVISSGQFYGSRSRKIAVVPDLTTRIHPELHTTVNIREFERYLAYALRHADRIATISACSRHDIVERTPAFPLAVEVMPLGVDPTFDHASPDARIPVKYGARGPYVLSVGTLEPRKNLRRLVAAFELVSSLPKWHDLSLVLVGPQGWDGEIRERVRQSNLARRVQLTGFAPLEDLPSLYHSAAAFVYPSVYEGFGLPVLEAMCSGATVLTSGVSALPELLGEGGKYFDPWCVESIAQTLSEALDASAHAQLSYRAYCRRRAEHVLRRADSSAPLPGLRPPSRQHRTCA